MRAGSERAVGFADAHARSSDGSCIIWSSIELTTPTQEWLSNQTVELVASISNLPFGTQLFYEWELRDESGQVVSNGGAPFQATGTVTEVTVEMKHFYNGDTFYRSSFKVFDQSNATIAEATQMEELRADFKP